jgi:transcriptional regulator with XRE-family HTH domain
VSEETVHERLRRIRIQRGESLTTLAERSGLRVDWLQAIEDGRFNDLPSGIYGRSALRRHSGSLGVDADEVLAFCAPFLPDVEDPISALGRLRGVSQPRRRAAAESLTAAVLKTRNDAPRDHPEQDVCELPSWRLLAAAGIDAIVVVGLLMAVVTCTVASGIPMSELGRGAAPAFALLTFVLGGCYFVVLGGLVGGTVGEQLAGVRVQKERRPLDVRAVRVRTMHCVLRDALFIEMFGRWIGRFIADHGWPGGLNQSHAEPPAA